ncbi:MULTISPECIES: glycosyltransferase [unclassified Blastococcus]
MIVLVPAYEPDARLLALVEALRAADPALHVLVVDDGSGPAARPVFAAVRALGCTVLGHPVNRGKGAALRTGLAHAAAAWPGEEVVTADSDGQHSVVDVLRVADRVRRTGATVLGVRGFDGAVPARSRLGNSASRVLFRLATGVALADTQTGLRGYPAHLVPWLLTVPGDRFEYELRVLLQAARRGLAVEQVPIATIYLEGNASSHFRPLVDSARVYAPLLAFLASSLAAFAVDTVALLALHALTGALLVSVAGARLLSGTANFAVNRRYVFPGGRRDRRAAALRYAALAGCLLAANYGLLAALTRAGVPLLAAKVLTEALLVVASFLVQRAVVFGVRDRVPAPAPRRPLERV